MKNLNNKWFTLAEMIIVMAILIALAIIAYLNYDPASSKDPVRKDKQNQVAWYLRQFKQDYGFYPNSVWGTENYPDGCKVTWYTTLMDCFDGLGYFNKKRKENAEIIKDPTGGKNNKGTEYAYYYWEKDNGISFKLCYLPFNQKKAGLLWLDGNTANEWSRYACVTSPDIDDTQITTLNK